MGPRKRKREAFEEEEEEEETAEKEWPCSICLDNMALPGSSLVIANPCGHVLHKGCFDDLQAHSAAEEMELQCPSCKQGFESHTRPYLCDGVSLRPAAAEKSSQVELSPIDACRIVVLDLWKASNSSEAVAVLKTMRYLLPNNIAYASRFAGQSQRDGRSRVIGEIGCIQAVLFMLNKFGEDQELSFRVCSVLRRLFFNNEANCKVALEANAVPAISQALSSGNPLKVQQRATGALRSLLFHDSTELGATTFVAGGGLKNLVAAMNQRADDEMVQEDGCVIFRLLNKAEDLQSDLVNAGCLSTVSASIERHALCAIIQRKGLRFLKQCSQNLLVQLPAASGEGKDSRAAARSLQTQILQDKSAEGRKIFVAKGYLNNLVSAMKRRPGDEQLQETGCEIFLHLFAVASLQSHLLQEGCLSAAAAAVERHYTKAKIRLLGLRFLRTFSSKFE